MLDTFYTVKNVSKLMNGNKEVVMNSVTLVLVKTPQIMDILVVENVKEDYYLTLKKSVSTMVSKPPLPTVKTTLLIKDKLFVLNVMKDTDTMLPEINVCN